MTTTDPRVDDFIRNATQWQEETVALREILLDAGLTEEYKWRQPCYTHGGGNVAILGGFKDHCVLSFFKGALLKDPKGILEKPGDATRSGRVIRFNNVAEIRKSAPTVKAYVKEAIANEEAGLSVDFSKGREVDIPPEVDRKIDELPGLRAAFDALTPGRRRAWLLFFSGAKQPKTRESRVEKASTKILEGKGPNDY